MNDIPFLFINITVFSCFLLMFVTFLATKKTPEIWAFLAVLLDAILWSGGAILMRLQMWPGMNFWYKVSLVALFSIVFAALLMYALYKRRMFRLTLVVSRSLLTLVLAVICAIAAANFISPLHLLPSRPWGWTSAPPPRWCPWRLPDCWAAHTFSCGCCWRPCSPGKSSKAAW